MRSCNSESPFLPIVVDPGGFHNSGVPQEKTSMTPDQLFLISGRVAMIGWLALALALFVPPAWSRRLTLFGGRVVPLLLSSAYAACIAVWWSGSDGGFDSLDAVARLFSHQGLLLAGWIHYLAFDLLVGRWQLDQALAAPRGSGMRWLALPCLAATLMFGPVGLLLFLALAAARRGAGTATQGVV